MNLYNILALIPIIIIIIYSCSCFMNYKEGLTAQTQYNKQKSIERILPLLYSLTAPLATTACMYRFPFFFVFF